MPYLVKTILVFFLLICSDTNSSAQDSTHHKASTYLSAQILGPEVIGFNININLHHRLSLNLGMGINIDFHVGSNYYITDRRKGHHSLFVGAQLTSIREFRDSKRQLGAYLPLGYEFLGKKGFMFQLEAGPNFVKDDFGGQTNAHKFNFAVRIGGRL